MMAQRGEVLELGDGRVFGKKESNSEELDAKTVLEVVTEMHGKDVSVNSVSFDTSKAAIERAIGAIAPRGKKAKMVREVLQNVADRGGVSVVTKEKVLEYKPGEE